MDLLEKFWKFHETVCRTRLKLKAESENGCDARRVWSALWGCAAPLINTERPSERVVLQPTSATGRAWLMRGSCNWERKRVKAHNHPRGIISPLMVHFKETDKCLITFFVGSFFMNWRRLLFKSWNFFLIFLSVEFWYFENESLMLLWLLCVLGGRERRVRGNERGHHHGARLPRTLRTRHQCHPRGNRLERDRRRSVF